jgi:hypothetical protein
MDRKLLLQTLRELRAYRRAVQDKLTMAESLAAGHVTDYDFERYHLGMVADEAELARIEEHYLGCPECAERAEQAADYVDTMRAAIIKGNFDLK